MEIGVSCYLTMIKLNKNERLWNLDLQTDRVNTMNWLKSFIYLIVPILYL